MFLPSVTISPREVPLPVPGAPPTFGVWLPEFFAVSQIVGLIGMSVILIAVLVLKVQRHPTFVSFAVSWWMSALSYSLLTFGGQQIGPEPHLGLCLTQASLAYGAPTLTGLTTAALVLQLWFNLANLKGQPQRSPYLAYALLAVPYVMYSILIIISIALGVGHPENVRRAGSGVYCIIDGPMGKISVAFVLLSTLITVGFEIFITIAFYKNWRTHRNTGASSSMLVRILIFSFWSILTVGVSLVFVTSIFTPLPNIFIALMPVMAFVIFGTQTDILRAYKFWERSVGGDPTLTRLSSSPNYPN